jgi:type II secretory pathway pseudopilin PulG
MENRLNIRISEMDKRLSAKIETSEKIAGILVLVVLAAMALPQILGYFRDRRERKDLKKQQDIQESLQGQIDELRQEIAELKTPKL